MRENILTTDYMLDNCFLMTNMLTALKAFQNSSGSFSFLGRDILLE